VTTVVGHLIHLWQSSSAVPGVGVTNDLRERSPAKWKNLVSGPDPVSEPDAKYVCVFPATFAQQRLWFLEQLQPGSTSYLIPWSLRISGNLNEEALERSLNEIVRRHEILRTTFAWKDGLLVQVVAGELSVPIPVLDPSFSANREQEAQRLASEEAHKPSDLEGGPLMRAQLLRLGAEEHILLLTCITSFSTVGREESW
jgi:Condensation domain